MERSFVVFCLQSNNHNDFNADFGWLHRITTLHFVSIIKRWPQSSQVEVISLVFGTVWTWPNWSEYGHTLICDEHRE